jgi:hypothetical protein
VCMECIKVGITYARKGAACSALGRMLTHQRQRKRGCGHHSLLSLRHERPRISARSSAARRPWTNNRCACTRARGSDAIRVARVWAHCTKVSGDAIEHAEAGARAQEKGALSYLWRRLTAHHGRHTLGCPHKSLGARTFVKPDLRVKEEAFLA